MSVLSRIPKLPQRKKIFSDLCCTDSGLYCLCKVTVSHRRTVLVSRTRHVYQAGKVSRTRFVWQTGEISRTRCVWQAGELMSLEGMHGLYEFIVFSRKSLLDASLKTQLPHTEFISWILTKGNFGVSGEWSVGPEDFFLLYESEGTFCCCC